MMSDSWGVLGVILPGHNDVRQLRCVGCDLDGHSLKLQLFGRHTDGVLASLHRVQMVVTICSC